MKKIALTGKLGAEKFAVVDSSDFEWLSGFKWHGGTDGYAYASFYQRDRQKTFQKSMQSLIMGRSLNGKEIDHVNNNKLDNRRINLRFVTSSQNKWNIKMFRHNSSGFLGVSFYRRIKKWRAYIGLNGKQIHLGLYDNKKEAIEARRIGKLKYHTI